MNNCLNKPNIIGLNENDAIYRIFKYKYLLDLFEKKRNILVKPILWNDPFENILYESSIRSKIGDSLFRLIGYGRHFGQCWTLKEESDAMWKIYSPGRCGIKVKSTVSKIFDPINNDCENTKKINQKKRPGLLILENQKEIFQTIIGKVEYLNESELLSKLINKDNIYTDDTLRILKTFLFKRIPFDYEKEVRIIYYHYQEPCEEFIQFSYPIEPNEVIEEIIFDPISEESFVNLATQEIMKCGYENKISKSKLYDKPNLIIDFHER